jgi:methionine-S-sulfoxide reductase
MSENTETAILAGGCFWPAQELLRHRDGVISTRVGYTGGENDNPTAGNHPGHAEAVEVIFDPGRTSYRDILEFFLQIHRPDPGEGVVGSGYRSEIFSANDDQAPDRRGHDRRRRRRRLRLRHVARQGRNQDQRGRPLLGGRGRGSGLPAALPQRQESVQSLAERGPSRRANLREF